VLALLGAAMLAAVFANPTIANRPAARPAFREDSGLTLAPEKPPLIMTGPPNDSATVPTWLGWLMTVLCGAMVLGVIGLLVWMLIRNRLAGRSHDAVVEGDAPPTPAQTARRVWQVLEQGLSDLDEDDADPRRVVIACWVRLEEAAAAAGIARSAGDTSTELVSRLLAATAVSPDILDRFAAVYREARFATHIVDVAMRDQARAALTQLRDELALGVS
jgi:hypothetical protein